MPSQHNQKKKRSVVRTEALIVRQIWSLCVIEAPLGFEFERQGLP